MRACFAIVCPRWRARRVLIVDSGVNAQGGSRGMSRAFARVLAVLMALTLVAAACGDDAGGGDANATDGGGTDVGTDAGTGEQIDYEAIGLWNDGPCDDAKDPLVIGLMTVFQSPVLSLEDQAIALEASADA